MGIEQLNTEVIETVLALGVYLDTRRSTHLSERTA
jgi:hypothetical protein